MSVAISLFNNILAIFKSVTGPYVLFGFFLAALLYLLVIKDKKDKDVLAYLGVIILILFFNPATFWLIGKKVLGDQSYCRMLWTVPQVIVMAYAGSDIVLKQAEKAKQYLVCITCILMLMVSGRLIYNRDNFSLRDNFYGLSDEVVEIAKAIEPSEIDGQDTRVTAHPEITSQIRQVVEFPMLRFDRLGYAENGGSKEAYTELFEEHPCVEGLIAAANSGHAYLIIKRTQDSPQFIEQGCYVAHETENYILYCLDNIPYE